MAGALLLLFKTGSISIYIVGHYEINLINTLITTLLMQLKCLKDQNFAKTVHNLTSKLDELDFKVF